MHTTFAGKRIVVGVTGSIAAFKVAGWVSSLTKEEARVAVIMTDSACRFVAPLTFAALSGERVHSALFAEEGAETIPHIQLAREADLLVIAPATAHTIARLAHGLADDLLTCTVLATRAQVLVCPAMNSQMYNHPAVQENIEKLKGYGYQILTQESGRMACREEGPGRLPEWELVREVMLQILAVPDLAGEKILVTAGPTREPLDPARFLSNRSSGKMGYSLARTARRRGAEVTLITGPTALACPPGVRCVEIETAREMHEAVLAHCRQASVIVKAAAVSDFRPATPFAEKVKKEQADLQLSLEQTTDILKELGKLKKKAGFLLVGFAAESHNHVAEGEKKLKKKNLDLIAINDIGSVDTGFAADTNQVTLLDQDGISPLPLVSKEQTADLIWDHVVRLLAKKNKE
ncbi:MAG: bifunctional phosphopantothenoylcysteine decarboxylase/phosphopantothenate--cysteine ligase CoaBC [Desulfocapsaceae bacterium]|nr:bifunctional phosphopantothenoylcysteine decarboxylase/phosphopantothenate--cysteine ligase CoaBC [Desulfocapsaceae bacterium]